MSPQAPPWVDKSPTPRTVLVFLTESIWTPHHATGLEIAKGHVEAGDDVHVVGCPATLPSCAVNPHHRKFRCTLCRSSFEVGLETLGLGDDKRHLLPQPLPPVGLSNVATVSELRDARLDDLPVGRGVASSLVSTIRESEPDLEQHRSLIASMERAAILVASETGRLLDRLRPDIVYVFNGRYAESFPVITLCRRLGIRLYSHDLGYEPDTYRLVPDGTVHKLDFAKGMMRSLWEAASANPEARAEIAASFFDGRRYGGSGDAVERYRWAKDQRDGVVPGGVDDSSFTLKVGIFVSSEDEMSAVEDYRNPVYSDQLEALKAIVSHPWPSTTRLFVRSHPNLRGLDNTQTQVIHWARSFDHTSVIPPESDVDTYALAQACDVVLTFGSTVGIEAAYWGTPSVLVGRAVWEDLGVIRPTSHEAVIRSLEDPQSNEVDALPYGYMQRRWGLPFEHYVPWPKDERHRGGSVVLPTKVATVRSRLERAIDPSGGPVARLVELLGRGPARKFEDPRDPQRTEHGQR